MSNDLVWLVKLAFTGTIFGLIAWNLDLHSIWHTLSLAPRGPIGGALVICFLQMMLSALRLSIVISIFGRAITFRDALCATLEGAFFSQTFVSFIGGDAQRVWRIHKCGFSLRDAASGVALDRFMGIMSNHILVLMCTPYLLFALASHSIKVGLLVVAGGGIVAISLVLVIGFMRSRIATTFPHWIQTSRILRMLYEISTVGRHLLILDLQVFSALATGLAIALFNSFIFFLFLVAWNIPPLQALGCALLVPAVMEIAMLPITVAGWGVREGAIIFSFASFGVSSEVAFGSSVLYALITLGVGLLGGLLWLFERRKIGI